MDFEETVQHREYTLTYIKTNELAYVAKCQRWLSETYEDDGYIVKTDSNGEIIFEIIETFDLEKKIIVLIPGTESESDSEDSDCDTEKKSIKMSKLKSLTYNQSRKQDAFNDVRSFVRNVINSGGLLLRRSDS